MTSLISGDADIGFMGSEASIYTYINGAEDPAVKFAQLTQRAGNFLVGTNTPKQFFLVRPERKESAWRQGRRYAADGI